MAYRICVSLTEPTADGMKEAAAKAKDKGADLVEFRLDALEGFSDADLADVADLVESLCGAASADIGLVFTCRTADEGGINALSDSVRKAVSRALLMLDPRDAGIYLDAERGDFPRVVEERDRVRAGHIRIMGSIHDFEGVPDDLPDIALWLREAGADIVKAAVTPSCATASGDLLGFFGSFGHPFVLAGMGLSGVPARLLAPTLGAEFTFASLEAGKEAAPGQIPISEMLDLYRVKKWGEDTRLLGVIGNPLGHSLSPLLHNTVFGEKDIDAMYLPFQVTGDPIEFLDLWSGYGLYGASVTIPHKVRVIDYCAEVEPLAREIGAANTLKMLDDGGFLGANNDAPAVVDSIEAALGGGKGKKGKKKKAGKGKNGLRGKKVLLLGAGGAARAAAFGLRDAGCEVTITNRTADKADKLAEETGAKSVPYDERAGVEYDILVNATSVGMHPEVGDSPMPADALRPEALVMDMVYNPLETKLLSEAKDKGLITVPGTEMFVRQAARQLGMWFDIDAPLDVLREVMLGALS